ncbi:glutamate receptor 1-like [Panulirus ornatus]|uniref:glutamate receptor 1-like n=1 Tax=Panulirus ornatus TaxID=150431 RepID=UPI003A8A7085
MTGHQVRVVAKTLFPFMEFEPDSDAPGTTVTPRDSLDVRMLNTVARILNFTYEIRMAVDDQWGTQVDGNWTGMVGTLTEQRADISMMLFWSFARKQVIDFTRIYTSEPFIMITHKPRPKPRHLALVRPFVVELWLLILASIMVAGLVLWAMQKAWSSISGERGLHLSTALMHTWGIMLEDPLVHLPSNVVGQMLVGWWWVFCMLVTAVYRSSLIAHLTVPTTSQPIDHLDQLLALPGATWGIEPGYGLGWDWFKLNSNPRVQEMFRTLQVLSLEEQLEQVLRGRHAFFTWKYYIKTIIASRYTDRYGYTPIHVSRQEFIPGSTGWGVRKGLPFLEPVDRIHDKLVEAGLVDLWLHELFEAAMRETRAQMREAGAGGGSEGDALLLYSESGGELSKRALVLSLDHLQGAFYLHLLGLGAAALALLLERVSHAALST